MVNKNKNEKHQKMVTGVGVADTVEKVKRRIRWQQTATSKNPRITKQRQTIKEKDPNTRT